MKKSIFAIAAATAFTGAAQAQSSVSVYGILDVGYIGANASVRGVGNANPANAGLNNSSGYPVNQGGNYNQFGSSAESTSRIGFRGTEDLGGGLAAFFTVEFGLQPNNAQVMDTGVGQNRQTFVGVRQKGLGEMSFGTQYTSIHNAAAATDPGQLNNMMGNVIYDKAAGLSSTAAGSAMNGGTLLGFGGQQNNTSYTVRSTNMLRIATETMGGLKGNAFYVLNSANTSQQQINPVSANSSRAGSTGGQAQNYGWGLGLDFTYQKAFITANYQSFVNRTAGVSFDISANTILTGAPAAGYYGAGGAAFGTNVTDNQQYFAGTYDFGILKAYAQYVSRKVISQLDSSVYSQRTATQIGVRGFVSPKVETSLSGGIGKVQGFGYSAYDTVANAGGTALGTNTSRASFNGWQIGSNYWLSKRTNLYTIYGMQSTSNMTINYQAAGSSTAVANQPTSYKASNYAIGVRHTF